MMRFLIVVLCFASLVFGATLQKEHHFIGKINDMKLQDGILYVAGEGGLIAFDNTMQKVFINQTLTGVEKIAFTNIDADSKSEIVISNWLSFALIDDDGTEISRFDTSSSMVSSPLPIDIFTLNGTLKIALLERSGYYGDPDKLSFREYAPQNEFWKFPDIWSLSLTESLTIASGDIKFRNGKLYTMQYNYEAAHIYEHSLSDGSILRDFNASSATQFEIDTQNNLLIVGTNESTLKFYDLNSFSLRSEHTLNTNAKMIKIFGNYIAVVANDKGWLSDATTNTVYLFEYTNGSIVKLFDFPTSSKVVKSLLFEETNGITTLLFGAQAELYKLNTQGNVLQYTNLDNGIYDPYYNSINAMVVGNFGTTKQIVGALDLYATFENNASTMLYHNGMLLDKLKFINIDGDQSKELWTSDWYRTYVYDDNGSLLFILPKGARIVKAVDMDHDGNNDFVALLDTKIKAYNKSGEEIFDLNTSDRILNFDIKDIDNDNIQDIAYIAYTDNGNFIKIVNDANATVKHEVKVMQPATNINLFEYIFNPIDGGYSLVFNIGATYRLDINNAMSDYSEQYIGDNDFISEYFNTALLANIDDDPEVELITATSSGVQVYDIFFKNFDEQGYPITAPIKSIAMTLGTNNIRGISLLDTDVLVAADNLLALYSLDGTKKWEYSEQIDTVNWEENHFTHITPIYATNGNHKIFVSGYSLYEFDKNGNFLSKTKGSKRYMVTSSGNYANPFDVNTDGTITLGQMGLFGISSGISVPLPTVKIILEQGWNLIALPVDTSLNTSVAINNSFPKARYLWKYANNQWYFYSNDAQLLTLAQNQGYALFSQITSGEGFWLFNTQNEELSFSGNGYNIMQKESFQNLIPQEWYLLGSGQTLSTAALIPEFLWTYTQTGGWRIQSNNAELTLTIEENALPRIDTVGQGQGFWIYKQ